jgi:hypothetical protein
MVLLLVYLYELKIIVPGIVTKKNIFKRTKDKKNGYVHYDHLTAGY